jgi:hypothetical protein
MRLIWLDHYGIEPMTDDADPEWDEIIPYEPTELGEESDEDRSPPDLRKTHERRFDFQKRFGTKLFSDGALDRTVGTRK